MFVFYDTETTGISATFDQILQFAAVLTDDKFQEVDHLEIRCQLLPWVVPSPTALLVTKTDVSSLHNKDIPTFYEMASTIYEKITSWSPATFIGYNSISFDEQFLHRALWQALYPPYVTVTNGNGRFDLLQAIRAFLYFFPDALIVPKKENGKSILKLDQLAPINGFQNMKAHDALGDVEATIFIAKLLSNYNQKLWNVLLSRANKSSASSILLKGENVLLFESVKGNTRAFFCRVINNTSSQATLANLEYKWDTLKNAYKKEEHIEDIQKNLRTISLNKSPTIFTMTEAKELLGLDLSNNEKQQSDFINNSDDLFIKVSADLKAQEKVWPVSIEIEQKIYEGFPSKSDELLAKNFHVSTWEDRIKISEQFKDTRYSELASRYLYVEKQELLNNELRKKILSMIQDRLFSESDEREAFRTIEDALKELLEIEEGESFPPEETYKIRNYLESLKEQKCINSSA